MKHLKIVELLGEMTSRDRQLAIEYFESIFGSLSTPAQNRPTNRQVAVFQKLAKFTVVHESRSRLEGKERSVNRQTHNEYQRRNALIRKMGFKSYKEYLSGDLWKFIRSRVLLTSRNCVACGRMANQVHHGAYNKATLIGSSLRHLHPVCSRCHERAEFSQSGAKRCLDDANRILGITSCPPHRDVTEGVDSSLDREFASIVS